jgi:hypothetical protein
MPEITLSEPSPDEFGCCERRSMAALLGIDDSDPAVSALYASGFRPSTVSLLELLPLIEIAWADGAITPRERRILVSAAARRPAVRGQAHTQLNQWLTERPTDEMFQTSRRTLRDLLDRADAEAAARARQTLLAETTLVLSDEGGLLGDDAPMTPAQQRLLSDLAADLGLLPQTVGADTFQ